mmetsp:Transcript_39933/g.92005  ORF Transcript_39933/g.92005 Transcript_39933/m.92005 type:complete len:165 (+) Transcript_39933:60-554(+)
MVDKALDDIISQGPRSKGKGKGRGKGSRKGGGKGDKEFWGGEDSCPWGASAIDNFWTHDDRVDDAKPESPAGWVVEGASKGKRGKGKGRRSSAMADDVWEDRSAGKGRKGGKGKGGKGSKGSGEWQWVPYEDDGYGAVRRGRNKGDGKGGGGNWKHDLYDPYWL